MVWELPTLSQRVPASQQTWRARALCFVGNATFQQSYRRVKLGTSGTAGLGQSTSPWMSKTHGFVMLVPRHLAR